MDQMKPSPKLISFGDIFMQEASSAMQLVTTFTGVQRLLSGLLPVSLACCFTMDILHSSRDFLLHSSRDFPGEIHGDPDLGSKLHRAAAACCSKCPAAAGILETTHKHYLGLLNEINIW